MKKAAILSATVFALSATSAYAEPFSGPFIGIDLGYDQFEGQELESSKESGNSGTATYSYEGFSKEDGRSANGLNGGIFVGIDGRINSKLFAGVELRAGISNAKYAETYSEKGSYTDTAFPNDNYSYDESGKASLRAKESFSATARVGYLLNDSTGIYLRGGIVQTRFKLSDSDEFAVADDADGDPIYRKSIKDSNVGLLYGAGLETALGENTSLRVEYNIAQYGGVFKKLHAYNNEEGDASSTKVSNHQVRLGLAYRF